jgi:hypothetical protein
MVLEALGFSSLIAAGLITQTDILLYEQCMVARAVSISYSFDVFNYPIIDNPNSTNATTSANDTASGGNSTQADNSALNSTTNNDADARFVSGTSRRRRQLLSASTRQQQRPFYGSALLRPHQFAGSGGAYKMVSSQGTLGTNTAAGAGPQAKAHHHHTRGSTLRKPKPGVVKHTSSSHPEHQQGLQAHQRSLLGSSSTAGAHGLHGAASQSLLSGTTSFNPEGGGSGPQASNLRMPHGSDMPMTHKGRGLLRGTSGGTGTSGSSKLTNSGQTHS